MIVMLRTLCLLIRIFLKMLKLLCLYSLIVMKFSVSYSHYICLCFYMFNKFPTRLMTIQLCFSPKNGKSSLFLFGKYYSSKLVFGFDNIQPSTFSSDCKILRQIIPGQVASNKIPGAAAGCVGKCYFTTFNDSRTSFSIVRETPQFTQYINNC